MCTLIHLYLIHLHDRSLVTQEQELLWLNCMADDGTVTGMVLKHCV